MYSLLWSEHCAYKHSKKLLRTLPISGPHVVVGPGENAGAVDVGGGLACAFKVESHNHPSAVEPFQGAATGVGGILRDIFALGARPIAVLDSLRFGEAARERGLLVSLQDLGAAGLTSSASEMASKGGVGIDLDVSRVPLREPGMEPFEVMVSESQERMLCVVEPANVEEVLALCERREVGGS